MKVLNLKNRSLYITINADGSLLISEDGINSIPNAGNFIMSMGGIEKVISICVEGDHTFEECQAIVEAKRQERIAERAADKAWRENYKKQAAERMAKYAEEQNAKYERLLAENGGVIPTTIENISLVLWKLNQENWGSWTLPKMTIGYTCNQYDCDGKIATTMTLDKPIDIREEDEMEDSLPEMESRFVFGAPRGHLTKYHRC